MLIKIHQGLWTVSNRREFEKRPEACSWDTEHDLPWLFFQTDSDAGVGILRIF